MKLLEIHSVYEMVHLGKCLGERLKTGDLLFLSGELGAGKTTLVKGIAEGLEIKDDITSPTFQIQKSYQGRFSLYHLDLYRLKNPSELDIIEPEEFIYNGITLVEWGDLLRDKLCQDYLEIMIEYTGNVNERTVSFYPNGIRYKSMIEGLTIC
jgi:tRNA threonylcarbamoyladenosine biosynthesis protein TsaE